jgi:hypothetical protein
MPGGPSAKLTIPLVILVSAAALFGLLSLLLEGGGRGNPPIVLAGREEVVFDWDRDACEPIDLPDTPARAFRDQNGKVQLYSSHYVTRRFTGDSLSRLEHPCRLAMSSSFDPLPTRFDDRSWLSSIWTPDGRTIYGLVHEEYQGNTHPGRCPSGVYRRCWYSAITSASSRDGGRTFSRAMPPVLVASDPYPYLPDFGRPYGVFAPSNIVRKGDYLYVLLHVESYGAQRNGTCLARTRDPSDPGSWRAWDGHAFSIQFANPYATPPPVPNDHVCEPVGRAEIERMSNSLTFNTYLGKYLLVGVSGGYDPAQRRSEWGFYYSVSDDLIRWSQRKLLHETELPWTYRCGDRNPVLYPSLLDPASHSRNFETTGRRPYLFFTRFAYASCRQQLERDLVRIRVEIEK